MLYSRNRIKNLDMITEYKKIFEKFFDFFCQKNLKNKFLSF